MSGTLVFVGEKRSPRAIALGVRWEDGHLAAKVLFAALDACGIDPLDCAYINLWRDGDGWAPNAGALAFVAALSAGGARVVALGRRVQRELGQAGVPCVYLTHPAARGSIRRTDRYRAHVAAVLG